MSVLDIIILQDDMSTESWWGPDGLGVPESGSLSLRGLAAAVRKTDDLDAVLNALAKVRGVGRQELEQWDAWDEQWTCTTRNCCQVGDESQ